MKVACKEHRRQEGTQKRKPRNKRQINRNKQRITTYIYIIGGGKSSSAGYGRKAAIEAVQDNPVRKTTTRTTNAPHSEKKGEGNGDSNQIKIKE